jgi:poly-beta-1,6-N-acetyl-D-glucosamine synthase
MSASAYVIITPARDEAKYLQQTIDSVVAQTIRPAKWIIVNDGSADGTAELIEAAAGRHDWIHGVHRPDRGVRKAGGGVMEAFYAGYDLLGDQPWDYIVKLDGDLIFANDYFERCLRHFEADPKLGIGGGTIHVQRPSGTQVEAPNEPAFHVRGPTKIYRRACWQAIGGLVRATGWDTVDQLKANMLGWTTQSFPEIPLVHLRETGMAYGAWKDWVKNGRANYLTGYHPLFMLFKCAKRLLIRPNVIAALALFTGYFGASLRHEERAADAELIKYVHRQQLNRLLFRKSLWG